MQIIMHLYHCNECVANFGVEAHEDLDHSVVVCPFCKEETHLDGLADNVPTVEFEVLQAGDPVEG